MYLAESQFFGILGKLISCAITSIMVFQYYDRRYFRNYDSRVIYFGLRIVCCIINFAVCILNNPALNLSFWLVAVAFVGKVFYYDENSNKRTYFLVNIAFVFAYSICESVGVILAYSLGNLMDIDQKEPIYSFISMVSGSVTAILLYYLILQKIFLGERIKKISVRQYTIYAAITVCTLLNIGEILFLTKYEFGYKEYIFLILDGVFIIFINLYLLNVLDTFAENKDLKYKLDLYERQAKSNYEYYMKQMESRKMILSVIHDVQKHINVLHELKKSEIQEEMGEYMDSFEDMVAPLISGQYSNNAILNVIINDKLDYCQKSGIQFDIDIQEVQISFMNPIDITTVFGNILDNAVIACEKAEEKRMKLRVFPFNGFVLVQLSNTFSGEIFWDGKGMPVSQKGDKHGIGLENVEKVLEKYCGEVQFKVEENVFTIEIILSQP